MPILKRVAFTLKADDGSDLLELTFADGRLDVIGDESRYTAAAALFVAEVRSVLSAGQPSKIRLCSTCNTRCVGQWLE